MPCLLAQSWSGSLICVKWCKTLTTKVNSLRCHLGISRTRRTAGTLLHVSKAHRVRQGARTVTLGMLLSKNGKDVPLDGTTMTLSRSWRYSRALTLASSLLQLYSSRWIKKSWSKHEVHFFKSAEGSTQPVIFDKLYLVQKFSRDAPRATNPSDHSHNSRFSARNIESLCAVLLELCFGEVVEDEPIRWNCLGVLGQLNGMTDLYTTRRWWDKPCTG